MPKHPKRKRREEPGEDKRLRPGPKPSGPTQRTRNLLEVMALAEAARVDVNDLEAAFRPRPPKSSSCQRGTAKSHHHKLYKTMLVKARKVFRALAAASTLGGDRMQNVGAEQIPLRAFVSMLRAAREVADTQTPLYKTSEGQKNAGVLHHAIVTYPVVWKRMWKDLGLGWSGEEGTAPPNLWTRAQMRRAAQICASGFSMTHAARTMGLGRGAVIQERARYPGYWNFLYQQARANMGLAQGQRVVSQIIDEDDQVVVRTPRGMSLVARRKRRQSRGIKPRSSPPPLREQLASLVQSAKAKTPKKDKEVSALVALRNHPDWNDGQIAEAAGCHRTSLYRMPLYKAARKIISEGSPPPKGHKNSETGEIEAYDD